MRINLLYILLVIGLNSQNSFAQDAAPPFDSTAHRFASTIAPSDLQRHMNILASDEFEGRETGKKGQKMAAEYISAIFDKLDFERTNSDGTFYQYVPLVRESWEDPIISVDGTVYKFLEDFYCFKGSTAAMNLRADEIVFLGYGIDDEKYSDYEDVEVKGKVLLILSGEPKSKKGQYLITGTDQASKWSEEWRPKLSTAMKKGCKAVLMVDNDFDNSLKRFSYFISSESLSIPAEEKEKHYANTFYISPHMGAHIFKKALRYQRKINRRGKSKHITLLRELDFGIQKKKEELVTENVLGYMEGTDLKDELVVITCHYDHLGKDGDKIYNGADDDGSGTVALLEIAEAFSKAAANGHAPRRSILFMPVSGEEKGLLGSEYYSEHPVFPLKNTIANLNIDMVGRIDKPHDDNPNYVYVIGSDRLSTELHQINETANQTYTQLELDYTYNAEDDPNRFYYRSDHYNFAKNNIPVIFYFNGTHEDYHQETDTAEKIEFDVLAQRAQLVFYTAWQLANQDKRIEVDVEQE